MKGSRTHTTRTRMRMCVSCTTWDYRRLCSLMTCCQCSSWHGKPGSGVQISAKMLENLAWASLGPCSARLFDAVLCRPCSVFGSAWQDHESCRVLSPQAGALQVQERSGGGRDCKESWLASVRTERGGANDPSPSCDGSTLLQRHTRYRQYLRHKQRKCGVDALPRGNVHLSKCTAMLRCPSASLLRGDRHWCRVCLCVRHNNNLLHMNTRPGTGSSTLCGALSLPEAGATTIRDNVGHVSVQCS